MPQISLVGHLYQLHYDGDNDLHKKCLFEAFDTVKFQADVSLHCKDKTQLKTNKFALIFSSKLFAKIVADSESNQFQEYDVLCPDFEPDAMAKVLEVVNTGSTKLNIADERVYKDMVDIMQCLQINIKFKNKSILESPINIKQPLKKAVDKNSANPMTSHPLPDPLSIKIEAQSNLQENVKPKNTNEDVEILNMTANNNDLSADHDSAFFEMEDQTKEGKILRILPYSCQFCDKRFQLLIALERHERKHKTMGKHTESATGLGQLPKEEAIIPDTSSTENYHLKNTPISIQNVKTKIKLFSCEYCDETFSGFKSYNLHCQVHSGGSQSSLNQHQSTTDETDSYQSNALVQQNRMDISDRDTTLDIQGRNKRSRNKEKCYICPVCQSGKTTNSHLLTHVASNHCRDQIQLYYDKTQRQCGICGRKSKTYTHLVSHLVSTHQFLAQILPKSLMAELYNAKQAGMKNKKVEQFGISNDRMPAAVNLDVKNTMEEQEQNMSDLTCNEEQNRYGLNLEQEENSSTFSITREQRMEEKSSPANKMFLEGDQIENMREHYEEEEADLQIIEENEALSMTDRSHPLPSKSKRTFECPICLSNITTFNNRSVHIGRVHYRQEIERFYNKTSTQCIICENSFFNFSHLESHLISKHQILKEILSPELLEKIESERLGHRVNSSGDSLYKGPGFSNSLQDSSAFNCHLCANKFSKCEDYIIHLGNDHYFEELQQEFEDKKCGGCSDEVANESSLIAHLILDHKAIESITPEIISLLKNRIKYTKREEVESITSEMCQLKGRNKEETEKNVYKITEEEECLPMANASKRSRSSHSLASLYKCHLCPQHYSQYRSLMRHMASKHYQQELLDMIKDGKLECFECNTSFVSVEGRLSHLLSKHKVFESIIPPREQLMIGFAH